MNKVSEDMTLVIDIENDSVLGDKKSWVGKLEITKLVNMCCIDLMGPLFQTDAVFVLAPEVLKTTGNQKSRSEKADDDNMMALYARYIQDLKTKIIFANDQWIWLETTVDKLLLPNGQLLKDFTIWKRFHFDQDGMLKFQHISFDRGFEPWETSTICFNTDAQWSEDFGKKEVKEKMPKEEKLGGQTSKTGEKEPASTDAEDETLTITEESVTESETMTEPETPTSTEESVTEPGWAGERQTRKSNTHSKSSKIDDSSKRNRNMELGGSSKWFTYGRN